MSAVQIILDVLYVILSLVGITLIVYLVVFVRKLLIVVKKIDYLIEDITYKMENLNSTLTTIKKLNNYFNLAEAIAKRNLKTSIKFIAKNRDLAYKAVDYVKNLFNSDQEQTLNHE